MFCKNCGAENVNNSKFCLNCGAKLDDYTAPKKDLVMPDEIDNQQKNAKTQKICKILYILAVCSLLLSGIFVFCSLFALTIPFIVISTVFIVATIGLGIAYQSVKFHQAIKNRLLKQNIEGQTTKQKLPTQTLPPQDDQINYKK